MSFLLNDVTTAPSTPAMPGAHDGSPTLLSPTPLQLATTVHTGIGEMHAHAMTSPWRTCGGTTGAETLSPFDDARSLSSSLQSTRRRRGGDPNGSIPAESRDLAQTLLDLERMRRENQERLHESLRGDKLPQDTVTDVDFYRSPSLSSAISSVRRHRRGLLGVLPGASRAPSTLLLDESVTNSMVVLADTTRTPPAGFTATSSGQERAAGPVKPHEEAQLSSNPPSHTAAASGASEGDASAETPHPSVQDCRNSEVSPQCGISEKTGFAVATQRDAPAPRATEIWKSDGACPTKNVISRDLSSELSQCSPSDKVKGASIPGEEPKEYPTSALAASSLSHLTPSVLKSHVAHQDPSAAIPTGDSRSPIPHAAGSGATVNASRVVAERRSPSAATEGSPSTAHSASSAQTYAARHARVVAAMGSTFSPAASSPSKSPEASHGDPPDQPPSHAPKQTQCCEKGSERINVACDAVKSMPKEAGSFGCSLLPPPTSAITESKDKNPSGEATVKSAPLPNDEGARPRKIDEPPPAAAQRVRTYGNPRPVSAMRTTRMARQETSFFQKKSENPKGAGKASASGDRSVFASVPRPRRGSLLPHHISEAPPLTGSAADAVSTPRPNGGAPLHRTTTLTELRRQEVLRDRQIREQKAADETRTRLSVTQPMPSARRPAINAHPPTMKSDAGTPKECVPAPRMSSQDTAPQVSARRLSTVGRPRLSTRCAANPPPSLSALSKTSTTEGCITTNGLSKHGPQRGDGALRASSSLPQRPSSSLSSMRAPCTPLAGSARHPTVAGPSGSSVSIASSTDRTTDKKKVDACSPRGVAKPQLTSMGVPRSVAASNVSRNESTTHSLTEAHKNGVRSSGSPDLPRALAAPDSEIPSLERKKDVSPPAVPCLYRPRTPTPSPFSMECSGETAASSSSQPRATPFCVECGQRHLDDLAKFCAFCGHRRAYASC